MNWYRYKCCCGWECVFQQDDDRNGYSYSHASFQCGYCSRYFVELPEHIKVPDGALLVFDDQEVGVPYPSLVSVPFGSALVFDDQRAYETG